MIHSRKKENELDPDTQLEKQTFAATAKTLSPNREPDLHHSVGKTFQPIRLKFLAPKA